MKKIFHLAIPCKDLKEAKSFYQDLGCIIAREYTDRITINFFGDQVVCHLSPDKIDHHPQMYPRHFGATLIDQQEYNNFLEHVKQKNLPFFKEPFERYKGRKEEHKSFLLIDPSNNLLEFKYYANEQFIY